MNWRRVIFQVGFGILLILSLLWFLGWKEIARVLVSADLSFVFLGFIAAFSVNIVWAFNWRIFLGQAGYRPSTFGLFRLFFAAMFVNKVTPLGELGGEPFIAYVVSEDSDIPYENSFAAVLSAGLINTVPFFTFSITGIAYFLVFNQSGIVVTVLAFVMVMIAILLFSLFLIIWFRKELATNILAFLVIHINRVLAWIGISRQIPLEEITERIENFYDMFHSNLASTRSMAAALIIAHCGTFLAMLGLYTFLLAVGWKVQFFYVMFIIPVAGLASYMPLPGGLGGIEATLIGLLILVAGIQPAIASAAVVLHRATVYGFTAIVGAIALWQTSVSIGERFKKDTDVVGP